MIHKRTGVIYRAQRRAYFSDVCAHYLDDADELS